MPAVCGKIVWSGSGNWKEIRAQKRVSGQVHTRPAARVPPRRRGRESRSSARADAEETRAESVAGAPPPPAARSAHAGQQPGRG